MRQFKRVLALVLCFALVLSTMSVVTSAASSNVKKLATSVEVQPEAIQPEAETLTQMPFTLITEVFEYSNDVTGIVIDAGQIVRGNSIDVDTFTVSAVNTYNTTVAFDGARNVTAAYVSDEAALGDKGLASGRYIILELEYGFGLAGATTLIYTGGRNQLLDMQYTITQVKSGTYLGGIKFSDSVFLQHGMETPIVDEFTYESANGTPYRLFTPANADGGKFPLVLWLHGGGETGTNNESQMRANLGATVWASPENQAVRAAYVMAPQGSWNATNRANVKAAIDELIAAGKVDQYRIYVAGCSMGGGGTVNIVNDYPDFFAAAIPICAAGTVNAANAANWAANGVKSWFVHAINDPTVNISGTRTSVANLQEAGADVYSTEFADADIYNGHWSWIWVTRNFVDPVENGRGDIMSWLFAQAKDAPTKDFTVISDVFEYGNDTIAVAIDAGSDVLASSVTADMFAVSTTNLNPNNSAVWFEGARNVTAAYVSDESAVGNKGLEAGRYIILELEYGFTVAGASALGYIGGRNLVLIMNYKVEQNAEFAYADGAKTELYNYAKAGDVVLKAQDFAYGTLTDDAGYTNYRLFTPADTETAQPLVLWLHGAGETGTNNEAQIRANMGGVAWALPANQAARPAYVLAPQSTNGSWPVAERARVKGLIDTMIAEGKVDASRVYVAGCSMGGSGTWNIITDFPNYFAAAAMAPASANRSVASLMPLRHLPIWLVQTGADSEAGSVASFNNGKTAWADIKYTHFPAGYNGYPSDHWSWIPMLNNFYSAEYGTTIHAWMFAQTNKAGEIPFKLYTEVFEYSNDVTAVIIDAGKDVVASSLDLETFTVWAKNYNPNNNALVYDGARAVTNVYVNDKAERAAEGLEAGRYIVVELQYGFGVAGASTQVYTGRNLTLNMKYAVTQTKAFSYADEAEQAVTVYGQRGMMTPIVDEFAYGSYNNQLYRLFTPADTSVPQPLVLWLHGAGESGTNNEAQMRANLGATVWADPAHQAVRPAYVLAPQGLNRPSIKAVIDQLIADGKVDYRRVYVAGCSMGGGNTISMVNDYPSLFAAAIPICPAGTVNATNAAKWAANGVKSWFVHAVNDPTVNISGTRTSVANLTAAGADVYSTEFANVDPYNGHWSWVYVTRNFVDPVENGRGDIMSWLFAQSKPDADLPFTVVSDVFEYGNDTIAVVIDAGKDVLASSISAEGFAVSTTNLSPVDDAVWYEGARNVTAAYVSDENAVGDKGLESGRYIVLELENGFTVAGAAALGYIGGRNLVLKMNYAVSQLAAFEYANGGSYTATYAKAGEVVLQAKEFAYGTLTDDAGYTNYRLFTPADTSVAQPLVLWLHGGGETGTNNEAQIRANMGGVAWAKPENQALRPAYVLAPQSTNGSWPVAERARIKAYIDTLIDAGKVDADRIYVAGCSMGGSGTWNIITDFPHYFAAAITAPGGGNRSAASLIPLRHLPIWMIQTGEDGLASTVTTYNNALEVGANIRYTHFPEGYNGYPSDHWSWVPMLNNFYSVEYDTYLFDWIFAQTRVEAEKPFTLVSDVFEYGNDTVAVIIDAGRAVDGATINAETFAVSTTNLNPTNNAVWYEGARNVTAAYVSDENAIGDKGLEAGRYIVLELEYGFTVAGASALGYIGGRNLVLIMNYVVDQVAPFTYADGRVLETAPYVKNAAEVVLQADEFAYGTVTDDLGSNGYRLFTPADTSIAQPLVLWLHGAGESGTNNESQIRANEGGVAWAQAENQEKNPSYVLAPQASGGWSVAERARVKSVIDAMIAEGKVDPDRVYVAGCSMGGAGTWNIITDYPDFFAAAITCPGGTTRSAEAFALLKNMPIWVVQTGADTEASSVAAYATGMSIGADIKYTHFPAGYNGYPSDHWSWIPTLNNFYSDKYDMYIFDWFYAQTKVAVADVSLNTGKVVEIVAGYNATLPAYIEVGAATDLSLVLYGADNSIITTIAVDASGKYTVALDDAVVGTYKFMLYEGYKLVGSALISCVDRPVDLWAPVVSEDEGKTVITFADKISFASKYSVTVNGVALAKNLLSITDNVLTINTAVAEGQTIVVAGIKYPLLFPSYSFTFTFVK